MMDTEMVSIDSETAKNLALLAESNGLSTEKQVAKLLDDFCAKGGYPPEAGKGVEVE